MKNDVAAVAGRQGDTGLFAPASVTRRMYRETAVLLGWPRAILMQLAHPLVAAGVADHSNYQAKPTDRFLHTFDTALQIVFGTAGQARQAADRINAIHTRVRGRLRHPAGCWPAGTAYRADDPALLLWVHCTLIDSELLAYERFVRPLDPADQELCYQERKAAGALVGLSEAALPATLRDMRGYLKAELQSDRIAIRDEQRALARALLYPSIRGVPKKAFEPLAAVTAGMLPDKLRRGYRLELSLTRRAMCKVTPPLVRSVSAFLPAKARHYPPARASAILR